MRDAVPAWVIKHSYALRRWTHGVSMALALCRGRIAQLLDRVTPTDAGDGDDTPD